MTITSSGAAALAISGLRSMAITPDGTRVIYVGRRHSALRPPAGPVRPDGDIRGAARLNWIFVSPDGQSVGFAEGNTLKKVSASGGPVVPIASWSSSRGATWAQDDRIIFATSDPATGLRRMSAAGGVVTVLTRPPRRAANSITSGLRCCRTAGRCCSPSPPAGEARAAAQVAVLDLATGRLTVDCRAAATPTTSQPGIWYTRLRARFARSRSTSIGWKTTARR